MVTQLVGALALLSIPVQEHEHAIRRLALPGGKSIPIRSFAVGTEAEVSTLANSRADLLILRLKSLSANTKVLVKKLQNRKSGRRMVLLDLPLFSVRPANGAHWQNDWDADKNGKPDDDAPTWLQGRNAQGWYPVDAKNPDYIKTVTGANGLMARVAAAGFDGMLVDLPAFDRARAGFDVKLLADATIEARKRREGFATIVRNPGRFVNFPTVRGFFDGVLLDGIFYGESKPNVFSGEKHIEEEFEEIEFAFENEKLILTLSYTNVPRLIRDNARRAERHGVLTFTRPSRF